MTAIPETANNDNNSDNDEEHGQTQQGQGEDNQAGVTGQAPEGTEQLQDQGNTGTTVGQEEHQNNGTTERQQDHAIRTAMTITVHLQIGAPTEAHGAMMHASLRDHIGLQLHAVSITVMPAVGKCRD